MYRYGVVAIFALFLGFLGGWKTQGWRLGKEIATIRADTANLAEKQELAARGRETQLVIKLAEAQEARNVEVTDINRKHAAVVASLRNRPERPAPQAVVSEVPSPTPACVAATGEELARGDAEFLARYAADAARLETALNQCEAAYNALRTEE